jgi:transposase-like protein
VRSDLRGQWMHGAVKVKRYSEAEIAAILDEARPEGADDTVCQKYAINKQTLNRWRAKYGENALRLHPGPVQQIAELRAENERLKRIVAKQAADLAWLRSALSRRA